jgi:hypothetical protein
MLERKCESFCARHYNRSCIVTKINRFLNQLCNWEGKIFYV